DRRHVDLVASHRAVPTERAATLHGGCEGGQLVSRLVIRALSRQKSGLAEGGADAEIRRACRLEIDVSHGARPSALVISSTALRVRLARPAGKAKAALVPVVNEIDIGIVRPLALGTRADLEIDRVALRLVDEMVAVGDPGLETRGVAPLQHGRAAILDQHDLTLEHVNELVFGLVSVPE